MKEIPDNEFDKIFQKRVQEYEPLFEENAWDRMNRKLQRRDRIIFFRNTSAVLVLLLLFAGSLYLYFRPSNAINIVKVKKGNPSLHSGNSDVHPDAAERTYARNNNRATENNYPGLNGSGNRTTHSSINEKAHAYRNESTTSSENGTFPATEPEFASVQSLSIHKNDLPNPDPLNIAMASLNIPDTGKTAGQKKLKLSEPAKLSLAFSAGPDFNSVKSLAGNKPTLGFGLLFNAAFNNKLSLSTGVRYSDKSYSAGAYQYNIKNAGLQNAISGIDASCNVLEIPLRASYTFMTNKKNSISLNGGLSSYFMLKEKYVFQYTPQSGIKDYTLEKKNANQHYLSIADLSVTYRIKLNDPRVELGIEPYIKVPLSGVGEGKVYLKSSGVTLNLFYEISRKK